MNRFDSSRSTTPSSWWFGGGGVGINAIIDLNLDRKETIVILANYDSPTARRALQTIRETLGH